MTDQQFQIVMKRMDEFSNEQRELVDFLGRKFGRIDQRFEQVDQRFEQIDQRFEQMDKRVGRVEVSVESLRHDVQVVAEGVVMNGQRLDRHELRLASLEASLEYLQPVPGAVARLVEQVEALNRRVDAPS